MELIHADGAQVQLQMLTQFQFEAIASLATEYSDNDFEVIISEDAWLAESIEYGHLLFEEDSEWGGRVEGISHIGTDVILTGPTWRGMLSRKIIKPTIGQEIAVTGYSCICSVAASDDRVIVALYNYATVWVNGYNLTVSMNCFI